MTIGQVTISAADWIASRVSDRIALVAAGHKAQLAQQANGQAIQPTEENIGAQLDRRERERAMLAAQESYKRVAQRIKSRLANPLPPEGEGARPERTSAERAALIEGQRGSSKLATSVIAAENRAEAPSPANIQPRLEAMFGLAEGEAKKAEDRQAASVDEKEKGAAREIQIEMVFDEQADLEARSDAAFKKGLWDDLFAAEKRAERD